MADAPTTAVESLPRELTPEEVAARMDGVLRPSEADPSRLEAFLPSPCVQNHAANLASLRTGEIACVWFGGTMEGMGDISIYASSLEPGSDRWSTAVRLSDNPDRSEQNPVLFTTPGGELWLLHTSQPSGNQDEAVIKRRVSPGGLAHFGPASALLEARGVFVRQPIVVNQRGEWLLPAFNCGSLPGERWRGDMDSSVVLISTDGGRNWAAREVPGSLGAVHMNLVPAADGRLLAFFRSRWADAIMISRSEDGGWTWAPPTATDLPNNNASIQAIRLASGRVAIVYNHNSAALSPERREGLYDEVGDTEEADKRSQELARRAIWGVPRAPLVVALSEDDGASFPYRRVLEDGSGRCLSNNSREGLNRELSYPSILQAGDGRIHIAFTFYRRAIKHVVVSEDWIRDRDHQMPGARRKT